VDPALLSQFPILEEALQCLCERDRPQGERRSLSDLQNEQALRDDLHPRANRGNSQSDPNQPEVTMAQCTERLECTPRSPVG
jgi:hypothetical protein